MKEYNELDYSHLDKVLFSDSQLTKEDIITYYQKISSYLLPHVKHRPLTLERYPNGIEESGFYMKQIPDYFPDWIKRHTLDKKEGGTITHVICNDEKTLSYLANQGCITPHIWLSTKDDITYPDKLIFDLDPSGDDVTDVKPVALELKQLLASYGLTSYIMTTGSKGVHIIVPIVPNKTFDEVKSVADKLAEALVKQLPKHATTEQRKDKRDNKVFIDTLRNGYGQTSVAPYALRAKQGAPVATPLTWKEFKTKTFDPKRYSISNIFSRLGQIENPWKTIIETTSELPDGLNQKLKS